MIGFTDTALILFPKEESISQRGTAYKLNFKTSLDNLLMYLRHCGITPHVLYTDDVARSYKCDEMVYVSTLSKGDMFFVSKNCEGMSGAMRTAMIEFNEVYDKALKKYPIRENKNIESTFTDVIKRSNFAANEIIKKYKLICNFIRKGNPNYKVKSTVNDKRILLEVDVITFLPKTYISGTEVNQCGILDVPYGNRSLLVWGTV